MTKRSTSSLSHRSTKGLKIAILLLIILFVAEAIGGFIYINSKADKVDGNTSSQTTNPAPADKTKGASSTDRIVMTINGSHDTYVLRGEEYVEGYCHAVDLDEGDITSSIEMTTRSPTPLPTRKNNQRAASESCMW